MRTINFGIDLGTTNSLVAKFSNGSVEVFKNPVGFKETLPSCVAFRNDRQIIGDKAREWLLKDPMNVFAGFKRKMGTSEKYFSPQKNQFYTPVELSAIILSELRNFIHTQEKPESIVITIPASFDTVQSNATKKAGYDAGFKEVVLLQEPIAASLAFFNKQGDDEQKKGKWLVYDLGGGTFDVALIGITDTEMRVIDHQGDNYLGGLDFDHSIVMDILLPKLVAHTKNLELVSELNKRNGKYEKLYYIMLLKAEEAKKELSNVEQTEVELSFAFNGGDEEEVYLGISREELNACIHTRIGGTIEMINHVVSRNDLTFDDIEEIIMIGGSTYIPYVRDSILNETGIRVNCTADPTTAVAVGAAYYAGSKPAAREIAVENTASQPASPDTISLQLSYNKTTRDSEEYITAAVNNFKDGCFYRITRSDGGFDTGLKELKFRIGEFVTLRPNTVNEFKIRIFDAQQHELPVQVEPVHITHGLFNVFGQPLPEDISIEVDDLDANTTKCQLIFERNSILPLVKTIYREVSRTVRKNSDDQLIINVLEGNHKAHPNTNQTIGVIELKAGQLQGDLIKGSEVEIRLEMSESRDVTVKVNLLLFNQQFSNVFSPTERYVSVTKLRQEIREIRNMLHAEVQKASDAEDYEHASGVQQLSDKLDAMHDKIMQLSSDDISDLKYQLEEQKRKLAQQVYGSETNPQTIRLKEIYYSWKSTIDYWCEVHEDMPKTYKAEHEQLKQKEVAAFTSNSHFQVDSMQKAQARLLDKMIFNTPALTVSFFMHYALLPESEFTDPAKAKAVIAKGESAIERRHHEELKAYFRQLLSLTKDSVTIEKIAGTGLG